DADRGIRTRHDTGGQRYSDHRIFGRREFLMTALTMALMLVAGGQVPRVPPTSDEVETAFLENAWHIDDPEAGGYIAITLSRKYDLLKGPSRTIIIQTMKATKGADGKYRYSEPHMWRGTYEVKKAALEFYHA